MNSLKLESFFHRPVLITGLLFFLVAARSITAAEFPLYGSYRSTIKSDIPDLRHLPDSSQVVLSTEYSPILIELKDSASDTYNTRVHSSNSTINFFRRGVRTDLFVTGTYTGFAGKLRDDNLDYALENSRQNGAIFGGVSYHTARFSLSGGIGRMIAESVKREHWSTVTDSTGVYFFKSPWLIACAAKLALKNVSLSAGGSSGPVHSSISKIVNRESGSYRNFPVYLLKRNLQAGIEGAFPRVYFDVAFGFDAFRSADMITSTNAMPQDIAINAYNVKGKLRLTTRFTDSLFCNVHGTVAGGAVESYNFSRQQMTMFESNSLMMRSADMQCGMSLPLGFTFGAAAARAHLTMPAGYLRLSAFSNWSVFKPMDYRFSDASVEYSELGLFSMRAMQYKSINFYPEIALSYIKVRGKCMYEQKKIVVMFPVYGDTVRETFVNSRILCITPDFKVAFHLGKFDIRGSLFQKIPIELKNRGRASGNSSEADSNSSGKSRFYGGGGLSVSVIRNF